MSNFDQFFVGLPITLQLQPTSFFIGSTPRLAEDVVRLVPVFPPATREGVSSVPALNIGVGALGLLSLCILQEKLFGLDGGRRFATQWPFFGKLIRRKCLVA